MSIKLVHWGFFILFFLFFFGGGGHRLKFTNNIVFRSLMSYVLANSVDPDGMHHYVAFHLGLHCLGVSSLGKVNSMNRNLCSSWPANDTCISNLISSLGL